MTHLMEVGEVIQGKWRVVHLIAKGGFCEVYKAQHVSSKKLIAIKAQSPAVEFPLTDEVNIVRKLQGRDHFCDYVGFGTTHRCSYMMMQLVGENLYRLRCSQPTRTFSLSTTLRMGLQILQAIESFHAAGYVHRDIKPDNFAIGRLPASRGHVYMLDFGFATRHITGNGDVIIPREPRGFFGTKDYASINAHDHLPLGRRDDLWSFFYMIVECLAGHLPWERIKNRDYVGDLKKAYNNRDLVLEFSVDLTKFIDHLDSLEYEDKPNYELLASIFKKSIREHGIKSTDRFDWQRESEYVADTDAVDSSISAEIKMGHFLNLIFIVVFLSGVFMALYFAMR